MNLPVKGGSHNKNLRDGMSYSHGKYDYKLVLFGNIMPIE